jgi:hypothetical protein
VRSALASAKALPLRHGGALAGHQRGPPELCGSGERLRQRDHRLLGLAPHGQLRDTRLQEQRIAILGGTIDDRPACQSSPQYMLARGRFAGISTARRTFRHLVCPKV